MAVNTAATRGGLVRHLVSGRDVRFGNDENVDRRLGRDVVEGVDGLVLVHFFGGDHPCDDLTKQAIVHDSSPLCARALARWRILWYNTSRVYHATVKMSAGAVKIGGA